MAFPALARPDDVPLHMLFPESYEASKKEIARDFVYFGFIIVATVVLAATMNWVVTAQLGA